MRTTFIQSFAPLNFVFIISLEYFLSLYISFILLAKTEDEHNISYTLGQEC